MNTPWTFKVDDLLKELNVASEKGLTTEEVKSRRKMYGANRLRETKSRSMWAILIDQFESLIMVLLVVAAILSFVFGDTMQGAAVVAVILLTAAIGFITEVRAVRSMEALRNLTRVTTNVIRDGESQKITATELVPGDIVLLDGGDILTADLRVIEANRLQADESALTGESVPVSKTTKPLDEAVALADRKNMLFKGTAITRGSGAGVVVHVGMDTELGNISALIEEAEEEVTPIEKRLNQLGNKLIWVTITIAAIVSVLGIIRHKEVILMIETGIALAVAAIPEGLPIVATIALARGLMRMAKRNALINRLGSVETLGATNIIFSDKTGTLTENKMTVTNIVLDEGNIHINDSDSEGQATFQNEEQEVDVEKFDTLKKALQIGVLCNNASLSNNSNEDEESIGDPLETALLLAGKKAGFERPDLLQDMPEEREEAFDPENKMMATYHQQNGELYVAIKGAPESVLQVCTSILTADDTKKMDEQTREAWSEMNTKMADNGLRVLAVAEKYADSTDTPPYENLTFVGLVGLFDPPRQAVKDAIHSCRAAGIGVKMVTGDQRITARNVAAAVNLTKDSQAKVLEGQGLKHYEELSGQEKKDILDIPIFARVNPKQKLDLIAVHQEDGSIVAMTGDGVNDAPALKKADIGIAMGKRGTQVAREAADMILKDDAFSTIVTAVEYGRVIFKNIRKFVLFLLSGNVGEVLAVGFASLFSLPLPIKPLQILFINLLLDVFPAMALGVSEGYAKVMKQPPRDPKEPILTNSHWLMILGYGLIISLCILGSLGIAFYWLKLPTDQAVTISFMTLGFSRLFHVFNMRDRESSVFNNELSRNRYVWGAIVLCAAMLVAAIYVPGLSDVLKTYKPDFTAWGVILGMSIIPLIIGQTLKMRRRRHF
jgi:Ca2+-transporting ATPase